MLFKTPYNIIL